MSMLPPRWTTNIIHSIEHSGLDFTLSFEVNLFGEVISVDDPFSALPDSAKVLMLGTTDYRLVEQRLHQITAHYHLAFPLAGLGYLSGVEWTDFHDWLRKTWQTFDPVSVPDYVDFLSDPLAKRLYVLDNDNKTEVLQLLTTIVSAGEQWEEALEKTLLFHDPAWEALWTNFLPVIRKKYIRERIFKRFRLFQTESAWRYLLTALSQPANWEFYNSILESLGTFQHPEILQALKSFYHRQLTAEKRLGFFASHQLMDNLVKYPDREVVEIFYDALVMEKMDAAGNTLEKMLAVGETEDNIGPFLLRTLRQTNEPGRKIACLRAMSEMSGTRHLPSTEELETLLVWGIEQPKNDRFPIYFGRIIKRMPPEDTAKILEKQLTGTSTAVQEFIMETIYESECADFLPMVLSKLKNGTGNIWEKAISIVEDIGKKTAIPAAIPLLMGFQHSEKEEIKDKALATLCAILPKIPDPDAVQWLLEEADHPDKYLREAIAETLINLDHSEGENILSDLYHEQKSDGYSSADSALQKLTIRQRAQQIREQLQKEEDHLVLPIILRISRNGDAVDQQAVWQLLDYLFARLGPISHDFRRLAEWRYFGWASDSEIRQKIIGRPGGFAILGCLEGEGKIRFPEHHPDFGGWVFWGIPI